MSANEGSKKWSRELLFSVEPESVLVRVAGRGWIGGMGMVFCCEKDKGRVKG